MGKHDPGIAQLPDMEGDERLRRAGQLDQAADRETPGRSLVEQLHDLESQGIAERAEESRPPLRPVFNGLLVDGSRFDLFAVQSLEEVIIHGTYINDSL